MAYPGPKVHRVNRRKLGRGQYPITGNITTSMSKDTGGNYTITFSQAVAVSGNIPLTFTGGGTITNQTVISPTVVTILTGGTGTGTVATLANNPANVLGTRGQNISGTSHTG